ncbi:ActS/PrrB/RegB family redox-sensitive histidine kinase [Pacificimonas sp. WHA3]|uniref:histidine kinase n=1 Tax=Pacificimonas pallii TaxID=2827236 RepID=A0ABS6SBE6_9SPHN|nr:ActS/PrrB/RegB family redox-sensitive histidine kinase [Pacificimonas pallii]MBV7255743.1 ActS/PrrB/RegB family redox-sensitive histidine kinase [Pacificimonas pallii]
MKSATHPLPETLGIPGIRVRTLIMIRWMAIGGQAITLLIVALGLRFEFPYLAAAAAILASFILNCSLLFLYPRKARLVGGEALAHLGFDLVQLGVLLFLTGGIGNPFVVLMIVPVVVSATLLSSRATFVLIAIAIAILFADWQWARPLPWNGNPPAMPELLQGAIFAALAFTIIFIALYVLRVSLEARRWQQALVTTQAVLERETKMSALGAMAAAAAHELGGPLGTITLIAKDLNQELSGDPDFGADVELLAREAERCRAILTGIAQRSEAEAPFPELPLSTLLHEIAHDFPEARVPITVAPAATSLPIVPRTSELRHGLLNLVDNALRFATSEVVLAATADTDRLAIHIEDDGPGFRADLLPHLGEPYLGPSRSGSGGTGLGIFIATTLLERTGARVRFGNRQRGGARVEISWPQKEAEEQETII